MRLKLSAFVVGVILPCDTRQQVFIYTGANNQLQFPVAPGSFTKLSGNFAGVPTALAAALPLPKTLGEVQVFINNVAAPIYAVRADEITVQIPLRATPFDRVPFRVTRTGTESPRDSERHRKRAGNLLRGRRSLRARRRLEPGGGLRRARFAGPTRPTHSDFRNRGREPSTRTSRTAPRRQADWRGRGIRHSAGFRSTRRSSSSARFAAIPWTVADQPSSPTSLTSPVGSRSTVKGISTNAVSFGWLNESNNSRARDDSVGHGVGYASTVRLPARRSTATDGAACSRRRISTSTGSSTSAMVTDTDGTFRLTVSPGKYKLPSIMAPNYLETTIEDVEVKAGETTESSTVLAAKGTTTTVDVVEKSARLPPMPRRRSRSASFLPS